MSHKNKNKEERNYVLSNGETIHYEDFVSDLCKPGQEIMDDLTPQKAHLWHMSSCLMGEAGELFDAIKKHVLYGKELDIENIDEELGDIEFYLQGLRNGLDISRRVSIAGNTQKLQKRYHQNKFSNEQAQKRADKKEG